MQKCYVIKLLKANKTVAYTDLSSSQTNTTRGCKLCKSYQDIISVKNGQIQSMAQEIEMLQEINSKMAHEQITLSYIEMDYFKLTSTVTI